jgi:hypothetical protein
MLEEYREELQEMQREISEELRGSEAGDRGTETTVSFNGLLGRRGQNREPLQPFFARANIDWKTSGVMMRTLPT